MDGQALAKVFEFSHMALTRNLEGITHEEALRATTPEELAAPAENGNPLATRIAMLGFHEGYHGGQIGLLRRLLGHAGAIR